MSGRESGPDALEDLWRAIATLWVDAVKRELRSALAKIHAELLAEEAEKAEAKAAAAADAAARKVVADAAAPEAPAPQQIEIVIRDAVRQMLRGGGLDDDMAARYGLRRRAEARADAGAAEASGPAPVQSKYALRLDQMPRQGHGSASCPVCNPHLFR